MKKSEKGNEGPPARWFAYLADDERWDTWPLGDVRHMFAFFVQNLGDADSGPPDWASVPREAPRLWGYIAQRDATRTEDRRGAAPLGYRYEGGRTVEDEEGQRTLDLIRNMHDMGYTLRRIAAQLNAEGIPSSRGGTWGPSSVSYVLKER